MLTKESLKFLTTEELNNMLRIVMGNKGTDRIIKIIKRKQDLLFHY